VPTRPAQRAQLKAKLIVSGAFSLLLSFGEEKKVKETFRWARIINPRQHGADQNSPPSASRNFVTEFIPQSGVPCLPITPSTLSIQLFNTSTFFPIS
jgi:hypothetical protein